MSKTHIKAYQRLMGVTVDGLFEGESLGAAQQMMAQLDAYRAQPKDSDEEEITSKTGEVAAARKSITLGRLALEWCLAEADRWGDKQVSEERVKEYLRGCTRLNAPGHGKWLYDTYDALDAEKRWAHCAAAQGFAEDRGGGIMFKGAMPPHRSGVMEVKRDAEGGRRPGERWADLSEFYDAVRDVFIVAPPPGSLVVYRNRTDPDRGHLERLIEANHLGIRSVGANENSRRWVVDHLAIPWRVMDKTDGVQRLVLLGFIVPVEAP